MLFTEVTFLVTKEKFLLDNLEYINPEEFEWRKKTP